MKLEDGQVLMFTGDSITDCDRGRPIGEGQGLGSGYVAIVDQLLAALHPQKLIRVLNTGVSGERVTSLKQRWQRDVLDIAPNWLSIMIGINDVWRHFDNLEPDQVDIDLYESTYRDILDWVRPTLDGLVLMTPFVHETNRQEPMRAMLDDYGAVVKRLAPEYDAILVDVQGAFDDTMQYRAAQSLSDDRVHPNPTGHMIIAHAFARAIELL